MEKGKESRTTAQEISIKLTKENLFLEKNVGGIVSATQLLDHYEPIKAGNLTTFKKQTQMWQYLKEGRPLKGLLEMAVDQRAGKPYVWLNFQLPRGNFEIRFDILSPQMLEFITKYQIGAVSMNCSLEEMMEEANRIESVREIGYQSPNKFPYQSNEFAADEKVTDDGTNAESTTQD